MQKTLFILFVLCGFLSCKTTLILDDINAGNIPNSQNITSIDSSVISLVMPYKDNLESDMQETIGFSTVELVKGKPESRLTNYLADLFLEEGKRYARKQALNFVPDVAYLNYGGLRTDLPKGKITVGKIFELMPFENEMVLLKLNGDQMYRLAEKIAENGGDCIAGMKMGIKNGQAADLEVTGSPFDPAKDYWIVTNDYVAAGGDNMEMFTHPLKYVKTGIKIRDCFIDHMKKNYQAGKKISPELDGRIYMNSD